MESPEVTRTIGRIKNLSNLGCEDKLLEAIYNPVHAIRSQKISEQSEPGK